MKGSSTVRQSLELTRDLNNDSGSPLEKPQVAGIGEWRMSLRILEASMRMFQPYFQWAVGTRAGSSPANGMYLMPTSPDKANQK